MDRLPTWVKSMVISKKCNQKKTIREQIKAKKRALPEAEKRQLNRRIFERLMTEPLIAGAGMIYCYVSLPDEADTRVLIDYFFEHQRKVAVPRVENDKICFYYVNSWQDLQPGAMGILEPKAACLPARDSNKPIIIPGVAFDHSGNRLGYGGGYYDRFLAADPSLIKIAIAYEFQVVKDIPTEDFDQQVSTLITDKKIRRYVNDSD